MWNENMIVFIVVGEDLNIWNVKVMVCLSTYNIYCRYYLLLFAADKNYVLSSIH